MSARAGPAPELETSVVRSVTDAPLRMHGEFDFAVPPDVLWPRISEPELMADWFPLLTGGELDHARGAEPGRWSEGSRRTCRTRGMGTLHETIHHWDPPNAYAYEVRNRMMPIERHLALMSARPNGSGGTTMSWSQYFDLTGIAMRHAFPSVMVAMMNRGMDALARELGGRGGKMHRVR